MLRLHGLMLACALVPVGALAAPADQIQALRQEVAALQFDHALNLTQQQAQALLPLLQNAQAKVQGLKAQRAASQPALVAALTQAVSDLKTNGAISDSTLQTLKAAHSSSLGALRQDAVSFWQQVKDVLTTDQLQALRSVKFGIHPTRADAEANATKSEWGSHFAKRFLVMHTLLSDSFVALVQARAR